MTDAGQPLKAEVTITQRDRVGSQRTANAQYQQPVARDRTSAAFLHLLLSIEDVEHRADFFGLGGERFLERIRDVDVGSIVGRGVSVAEVVEELLAVGLPEGGPGTDYQWKGDCRCDCDEEPKTQDPHFSDPLGLDKSLLSQNSVSGPHPNSPTYNRAPVTFR